MSLQRANWQELQSFRLERVPSVTVIVGRILLIGLILTFLTLLFAPWQQTVTGTGKVVAYSPTDREQHLHAPVQGRIVRWHVVEGSRVKKGDAIVDLVDVDPSYMDRLRSRRDADLERIAAAENRAQAYDQKAEAYDRARELKVRAARLKVQMAEQKLQAAQQKRDAAEAALHTATLNLKRHKKMVDKGLVSQRDLEVAELAVNQAEADLNLSRAAVSEAEANQTALEAEALRADAEGGAKVATAKAQAQKATSDRAYARGDLAKVEVELARQASQTVEAPVDGVVVHIDGNEGGGIVSAGEHLAVLVPDTESRAVELYVDGRDAPLVNVGRKVRLQFEGWPAVQFVGWPSVAVGTFGGIVKFVDPASMDGKGRIRVLVVPDPKQNPWPDAKLLRQQVRAKGWVLLDQVSLGWEIWRVINGFPPSLEWKEKQTDDDVADIAPIARDTL